MTSLLGGMCVGDADFHHALARWNDADSRCNAARQEAPAGWSRFEEGVWVGFRPQTQQLPAQGWKGSRLGRSRQYSTGIAFLERWRGLGKRRTSGEAHIRFCEGPGGDSPSYSAPERSGCYLYSIQRTHDLFT
jgi:hypothetical protein